MVNGNNRIFPDNTTVQVLTETENKWNAPFVIFVNGANLHAEKYQSYILNEGDEVRIVYLMGGG